VCARFFRIIGIVKAKTRKRTEASFAGWLDSSPILDRDKNASIERVERSFSLIRCSYETINGDEILGLRGQSDLRRR
jgi:hypothetical protein